MQLKNPTILLLLVLLLCSCDRRVNGPELTESGEIYDTCFVPKGHGTGWSYGKHGGPVDVDIPAHYAVVFKCEHGKFVIEGDRGENLYNRFSRGDVVKIKYCIVYDVTDKGSNAVDLHFIDAVKDER